MEEDRFTRMSTNGRRMISLLEEGIGFDFLRTVSRGFLQAYREAFAYAYRNYDSGRSSRCVWVIFERQTSRRS